MLGQISNQRKRWENKYFTVAFGLFSCWHPMLIIDLILVRVLTMAVLFLHSSISLKRKLCRSTSPGMSTSESLLFKIGIFSFQGIPRFFEMAHETSRASLKCRFDGTYTQTVHAKLGPARSQSSRVLLTALDSD